MRRKLPWYAVEAICLVFALVLSNRSGSGVRDDEFLCEEAMSRLADCCGQEAINGLSCDYTGGCDQEPIYPVISPDESACIREASCDSLRARGVCEAIQADNLNTSSYPNLWCVAAARWPLSAQADVPDDFFEVEPRHMAPDPLPDETSTVADGQGDDGPPREPRWRVEAGYQGETVVTVPMYMGGASAGIGLPVGSSGVVVYPALHINVGQSEFGLTAWEVSVRSLFQVDHGVVHYGIEPMVGVLNVERVTRDATMRPLLLGAALLMGVDLVPTGEASAVQLLGRGGCAFTTIETLRPSDALSWYYSASIGYQF